MRKLILLAALFIIGSQSQAALNICKNLSTQIELNQCAASSLDASNKRISEVYSQYMKELNPSERVSLKESQQLWIQFKEKDCKFESSPVAKGSMYQYVHSACLIDRTEKRIAELEKMSNCDNGTEPSCI